MHLDSIEQNRNSSLMKLPLINLRPHVSKQRPIHSADHKQARSYRWKHKRWYRRYQQSVFLRNSCTRPGSSDEERVEDKVNDRHGWAAPRLKRRLGHPGRVRLEAEIQQSRGEEETNPAVNGIGVQVDEEDVGVTHGRGNNDDHAEDPVEEEGAGGSLFGLHVEVLQVVITHARSLAAEEPGEECGGVGGKEAGEWNDSLLCDLGFDTRGNKGHHHDVTQG